MLREDAGGLGGEQGKSTLNSSRTGRETPQQGLDGSLTVFGLYSGIVTPLKAPRLS